MTGWPVGGPVSCFRAAVRRIVLARGRTSYQEGAPGRPAQDAARHLGAHCQARPRAGAAPPGPQARRATGAGAGRRPGPAASTRGAGNGATRPPPGHHRPGNNPCFVGVAQVGARQLNKTPGFAGGRGQAARSPPSRDPSAARQQAPGHQGTTRSRSGAGAPISATAAATDTPRRAPGRTGAPASGSCCRHQRSPAERRGQPRGGAAFRSSSLFSLFSLSTLSTSTSSAAAAAAAASRAATVQA